MHTVVAEFYYVMNGTGKATVSGQRRQPAETAPIRAGDAIPIWLSEVHSFENTGTEPLEFLVVGVSTDYDLHHKAVDSVDVKSAP
jgi:mannose-6-phosphate isomerase-like protein (cupin superfamily)